jgi:pimeloyl-ACP methyl ester carboxylesterase
MRRGVAITVLVLVGVAAVVWGGCEVRRLLTRAMLYPAPPVGVPSPPLAPLEEVELDGEDGRVVAWYLAPPPEGPAVLVLHGNGENLETLRRSGIFDSWEALGAGVLAVDYPGYGRSAGSPSEAGAVAAAVAGLDWLGSRLPEGRRVVAGWSLGAAVGIQATRQRQGEVDGVVLMSPWSTLEEEAAAHFPRWLVRLVLAERYDSLSAAREMELPALVVHGEADRIIPAVLGRRLFGALPGPKRWVAVPGAGHNDLLGRRLPWEEIGRFLQELRSAGEGRGDRPRTP